MPVLKNGLSKKIMLGADKRINSKIIIGATTDVDERICKSFHGATVKLADQLEAEGMISDIPTCYCIFTDEEEVTFTFKENQFGGHIHFCWYPVGKWLKYGSSDKFILVCILEEFCHFYWNIEDEVEVCYKVLAIMQRISSKIKLSDLYDDENMEYRKNIKK